MFLRNGVAALLGSVLWVSGLASLGAQRVSIDLEAMPFAPRRYVCYRAPSRLNLDGRLDDPGWAGAPWSDAFIDIEGDRRPRPPFRTRVKIQLGMEPARRDQHAHARALGVHSVLTPDNRQRDGVFRR